MTEDQLEQEALEWLADVGHAVHHGPDIAPRDHFRQMLLPQRLRDAIARQSPHIPLVGGVPVQHQKDGETRGDLVRLTDLGERARSKNQTLQEDSLA